MGDDPRGAQWLGEAAVPAVGALPLSRTFESADEAHAFAGTFVAYLDGQEVGRETVGFGPCDAVSELGLDPTLIRSVFVHRTFDGGLSYQRCRPRFDRALLRGSPRGRRQGERYPGIVGVHRERLGAGGPFGAPQGTSLSDAASEAPVIVADWV